MKEIKYPIQEEKLTNFPLDEKPGDYIIEKSNLSDQQNVDFEQIRIDFEQGKKIKFTHE